MVETVTSTPEENYDWLDKEFLEKVLRTEGDPDVAVNSFEVKPATNAGDNYGSVMSRVTINLTRGKVQESKILILKRLPQKAYIKQKGTGNELFERESRALSTLLPEINRLYEQFAPGRFEPLSAKCYYSDVDTGVPIIVMEDLKEQGFRLADRRAGLDSKHCALVMRALGRLHAASLVLHEKKSELLKPFYEPAYKGALKDSLCALFGNGMHDLAKEVAKWPEDSEQFSHKLHKAADNIEKTLSSDIDYKEFNVFAHGDCWVNNMMFRYSEETGEVEEVRFVDYQLCAFGNPGQDIQYFFYGSATVDVMKDTQSLIQEYYKTLKESLILFDYKHLIPSFPDLLKRLEEKGNLAVMMSSVGLSFVYADENHIPDIEKRLSKDDNEGMHINEKHKQAIKVLLPIFVERGWL